MGQAERLRKLLEERIVFLDGATGTEFMKRGMPSGISTDAWAAENIDVTAAIHRDYVKAGADLVLAATFGGTGVKLGDPSLVEYVNRKLADCALEAVGTRALAGASIGPTGTLLHPSGGLRWREAYREFREQAGVLAAAGIEIFFLETFSDPRELKAAVLAVRDACPDGFISAQMTFLSAGLTLSGTSPTALAVLMNQLPADAVGVNCGTGPMELLPVTREILRFSEKRVSAEPNAGMPSGETWELEPERFAAWMEDFARSGVSLLGGCCGTGPDHVREYVSRIGHRPATEADVENIRALSSVDRLVIMDGGLRLVGESINPTGKKSLQASIEKGDFFSLVSLARAQGRADVIDVNLGLERLVPRGFVEELFGRLSIGPPLSVDLSDPLNMETAFRQLGGIGILNSLTASEEDIAEKAPILRRHGGYAVLLPLDGGKIPENPAERLALVERGIRILQDHGIPRDRVLADPLVRPVGAGADVHVVLDTLALYKKKNLLTIAGISNISHGMPRRSLLNSSFLSSMGLSGLDLAIADVMDSAVFDAARGVRMLTGAMEGLEVKTPELDPRSMSADFMAILRRSIIVGDGRQTEASARELLESGVGARKILEEGLAPAMKEVERLYVAGKLFLPHLIAAAESAKILIRLLSPHMAEAENTPSRGKVLLASVKGDVHDIGRNLVGLFLENAGFRVVDLGMDVPAEKIVEGAMREKADIVALSALMSTTVPEMEKVISLLKSNGVKAGILLGGAVLTADYADSIGADGYASNACEAVKAAEKLMEGD